MTVQTLTTASGLSSAAVQEAEDNHLFGLVAAGQPQQIWDVNYTGNLNGGSVLLTFHYNPALLAPGSDEANLEIFHFNHLANAWEHGRVGPVDTVNHTITYETFNFSQFQMFDPQLVQIPEPSTVTLLALGVVGMVGYAARARKRQRAARGC